MNKNTSPPARAFTQLCKNANFSLFGNTLTIYPKWQGVTIDTYDSHVPDAVKSINAAWKKLGDKIEIRQSHPTHNDFHQDDFVRKDWHTHIQFKEILNENKLRAVLDELVISQLITTEEEDQFLYAYRQANELSHEDFDKIMAQMYLDELNHSIHKRYSHSKHPEVINKTATIIDLFKQLIHEGHDLSQVHRYIKETQLVIEHPTHDNIKALNQLGSKAQKKPSQLWKVLGASFMTLGVALLAILICSPVGLLPGIGIALGGLGLFSAGLACYQPGQKKGLSKHFSELTEAIKDAAPTERASMPL